MANKTDNTDDNNILDKEHVATIANLLEQRLSEKFDSLYQQLKKYSACGSEKAEKSVKNHPLASVCIATSVGFLCGYLLNNSSNNKS